MSVTDVAIVIFIACMLMYAIYDEFIMDRLQGKTLLRVNLLRKNKLDCLIFVGLIAILLYNNITSDGTQLTSYLLVSLALIAFYISFIRWPKLLFKAKGFFYANAFIAYDRMKSINLSEDGVLVIQLEKRKLLIHVRDIDDLQKIYNLLIENQ
ncbi:DUF986 family protein [Edaphovirga cremea]|uniref:DUF986 family protein n=1 Tax=Edaphovirga cremea TaxID=2267246 RepID=UPI000DEF6A03|nr:DUF986 family protein [Edaphovirga cremea]